MGTLEGCVNFHPLYKETAHNEIKAMSNKMIMNTTEFLTLLVLRDAYVIPLILTDILLTLLIRAKYKPDCQNIEK